MGKVLRLVWKSCKNGGLFNKKIKTFDELHRENINNKTEGE